MKNHSFTNCRICKNYKKKKRLCWRIERIVSPKKTRLQFLPVSPETIPALVEKAQQHDHSLLLEDVQILRDDLDQMPPMQRAVAEYLYLGGELSEQDAKNLRMSRRTLRTHFDRLCEIRNPNPLLAARLKQLTKKTAKQSTKRQKLYMREENIISPSFVVAPHLI